ncbi:MAG: hypothetical protein HY903_25070 [Deltaproteobacteria bacterium]|nr:hypothetical protein [Deltaproteobacteria bacterium]
MRNFLLGCSVSVAFVAGLLASDRLIPPAKAATTTSKWEYLCEPKMPKPWKEEGEAVLRDLGAEGWELVLQMQNPNMDVWCFKRPGR